MEQIKVVRTIYPPKPHLDFNDWILYIHNQLKNGKSKHKITKRGG